MFAVVEDEGGRFVVAGEVGPVDVGTAVASWLTLRESAVFAPAPAAPQEARPSHR